MYLQTCACYNNFLMKKSFVFIKHNTSCARGSGRLRCLVLCATDTSISYYFGALFCQKKILWLLSDSSIGLTHKSAIGIDFLDETVNSKNVIIYNAAKCFLFSYM